MYTICDQIDSHIKQQQKAVKAEGRSDKRELSTTLQDLLTADDYSSVFDISLLSNPWRTVEAYHFFMLVQKLFYSGNFEESLKTVCPCAISLSVIDTVNILGHLSCGL